MRAELIAIGTEILLGHIVNSNTAFLGRALAGQGIGCYHQVTVGDNPERLGEALRLALSRSDLVITCGGLGPTVDDVTLETIAAVAGLPLVLRPSILRKIEGRFCKLGLRMPPSNRRQAMLPEGAQELPNSIGTAPGFLLKLDHVDNCIPTLESCQYLVALPGPPYEMIPIVQKELLPRLRKIAGGAVIRSRTIKTTGLTESEVDKKVADLLKLEGAVTMGIYARPGQVDLRITAGAPRAKEAEQLIASVEKKIRRRLGSLIYGTDDDELENVLGQLLRAKRKTVATAESCTGGLIGHRITEVPGSSDYYAGGVIAYSNTVKQSALGVPATLLRKHGAVSAQSAQAMARGIREKTGASIGLAVTGIAGPGGGTKQKPVGLVYIALADKNGAKSFRHQFSGTRAMVKTKTAQAALNLLRLYLMNKLAERPASHGEGN